MIAQRPLDRRGAGRHDASCGVLLCAGNGGPAMPDNQKRIVLIGGGGHAMVVAEAAIACGRTLAGFLDDDPAAHLGDLAERLGDLSGVPDLGEDAAIIALGNVGRRAEIITRLRAPAATVVHPSAIVSPSATLGKGVFIGPNAVVHARARIGDHAIVNTGAIVEHDCLIGMNTHIAPGVVMGGETRVGPETLIGLGSRLLPGVRVGSRCVVGAGAVVLRAVGDGERVVGVPAR
ncbi:MAG: acetyltransferase [Phycisphaerales bacterium]|nr:MAG: acetyltransferase [Phycisphaerales bacterium]